MLETDLNAGEHLKDNYALGVGGSLGVVAGITERWKMFPSARGVYHGLGDRYSLIDVALTQNYALTRNLSISVDVSRSRTHGFYRTEGQLSLNIFF